MRILFLYVVFCWLAQLPSWASSFDALQRQSLIDLPPLVVAVECSDDLSKAGLSCEDVKSGAEKRLTEAGVAIQPAGAPLDPSHRPAFLTLRLTAAKFVANHSFQLTAVTLEAEVVQDVIIPRLGKRFFPAGTWSSSHTEILGARRIPELKEDAAGLVEEFLKARQP